MDVVSRTIYIGRLVGIPILALIVMRLKNRRS